MAVAARETVHELPARHAAGLRSAPRPLRKRPRVIQFPFPSPLLHPEAADALLLAFRTSLEER